MIVGLAVCSNGAGAGPTVVTTLFDGSLPAIVAVAPTSAPSTNGSSVSTVQLPFVSALVFTVVPPGNVTVTVAPASAVPDTLVAPATGLFMVGLAV